MPNYILAKFAPTDKCPFGEFGVVDANVAFENPKLSKSVTRLVNQTLTIKYGSTSYPNTVIVDVGKCFIWFYIEHTFHITILGSNLKKLGDHAALLCDKAKSEVCKSSNKL